MLKIFSFQLPKETDHIRQRAETLELACWHSTYPVKTYCRVHTDRNRLLFEITITKNFGQGTGGGHGGGGQREMAISDRTMHTHCSVMNKEKLSTTNMCR